MDKAERYGIVKAYHEQTKHHAHRYARSLGYMDWDSQPIPFRLFDGAPHIKLPLINEDGGLPYSALYEPSGTPLETVSIESIARMLELGMGLSAWKKHGAAEWALRMNPSSGNLHPTECYLVLPDLDQQPAYITHYAPYQHVLEQRARLDQRQAAWLKSYGGFGIILTSIHWREAWKYGERAFRYCQHDLGHALGALRFACNLNGWQMKLIPQISATTLGQFLGFDTIKWVDGEPEHADCLCWVNIKTADTTELSEWILAQNNLQYKHNPNQFSRQHVDWEIIDMVQNASQINDPISFKNPGNLNQYTLHRQYNSPHTAEAIIRSRRSAQQYDRQLSRTDLSTFTDTLEKTLPGSGCPFDLFPYESQVHLVLFVHAVDGLDSGLYMLVRNPDHFESLKSLTDSSFSWNQVSENLPFYLLQKGDFRARAESISCGQAIAGDSAYSLGMLSRFDPVLMKSPSFYPQLFWETGLVGQVLYLEAEAHNLRATGIGCFLDDEVHDILGLEGGVWQSLYHFTVGRHVDDARLETKPAYFHLDN